MKEPDYSQPPAPKSTTLELAYIHPIRAGKVLGVLYPLLIFSGLVVQTLSVATSDTPFPAAVPNVVLPMLGGIVWTPVIGFIGGLLLALSYNIVASFVGGLLFDSTKPND